MNKINQSPDICIEKVCNSLAGGVMATYILVMGNASVYSSKNYISATSEVTYFDENKFYPKKNTYSWNYSVNNNLNVIKSSKINVINENVLENLKKLNEISLLKDNWNFNGAKAFSEELMLKVRTIIFFLDVQPEIFPTACDSIQLEYDKEDGSHMEIEITDGDEAEVFSIDKEGKESIKNIKSSFDMINKTVADFYG